MNATASGFFVCSRGLLSAAWLGLILAFGSVVAHVTAGSSPVYSIGRGIYYDQTAGGAPQLKLPYPYLFTAQVAGTNWDWVSLKGPDKTHTWDSLGKAYANTPYVLWRREADQAALAGTFGYPDGAYTFGLTGHGAILSITNTLGPGTFPNPPSISNLAAAQSVDPTNDFTLLWSALEGGTAADFVSVQLETVRSIAFATPVPGAAGALSGTATSVVIPAGTLQPGRAYLGRLVFAFTQSLSPEPLSGGACGTFYFSQTDFWLRTEGGSDNSPPTIAWTTVTNGAVNVPPNKPIGVYFTKRMQQNWSLWGRHRNTTSGHDSLAFSPDGLEAVLNLNDYTPQAQHSFVFNALGQPLNFGDLNGNPLAAETFVLSFTSGADRVPPRPARLVSPYWQGKSMRVNFEGEPDYSYTLEAWSGSGQWSTVGTCVAFGGTGYFVLNPASLGNFNLLRAVTQ